MPLLLFPAQGVRWPGKMAKNVVEQPPHLQRTNHVIVRKAERGRLAPVPCERIGRKIAMPDGRKIALDRAMLIIACLSQNIRMLHNPMVYVGWSCMYVCMRM